MAEREGDQLDGPAGRLDRRTGRRRQGVGFDPKGPVSSPRPSTLTRAPFLTRPAACKVSGIGDVALECLAARRG